jgi:hypothetical protein
MSSRDPDPYRMPGWVVAVILVASPFVGVGLFTVARVLIP